MKEYKVGEQITLEVEEAERWDDYSRKCNDCYFFGKYPNTGCTAALCMPKERSDNKNVIFVEKGK